MRLKELYLASTSTSVNGILSGVIEEIESKIKTGSILPYYINNVDLSKVCRSYLKDVLKQDHGVVISFHPDGIIIEDFI